MNFQVLHRLFLALLILVLPLTSQASDLLMRRVPLAFPEAMNALQSSIAKQGYRVSRVQRVDVGLTKSGYDTAEYRVVFFARPDQLDMIEEQHVKLVPFMPLKITIFAEGGDTILVTLNPRKLNEFFPDEGLEELFASWGKDVVEILDRVQTEQ